MRNVPLAASVCGNCSTSEYRWRHTDSDQQISDDGNWLGNCGFVEDVGGSKALFTLGGVITAVCYNGCNLIVEIVLRLVCTRRGMSVHSGDERVVGTYGYNGVNGAGIGEVSLYLTFVSGA